MDTWLCDDSHRPRAQVSPAFTSDNIPSRPIAIQITVEFNEIKRLTAVLIAQHVIRGKQFSH